MIRVQRTMRNARNVEHFEKMVIAGAIDYPGQIKRIRGLITEESFTLAPCREIWKVIDALEQQRSPIDRTIVANSLSKEAVMFIDSIEKSKFSDLEGYARELYGIKTSLQFRASVEEAAQGFENILLPVEETASNIMLAVNSFMSTQVIDEPYDYDSMTNAFMEYFEDSEAFGVKTGIPTLDHYIGGFERDQLILIAARPSVGKSAMALQIGTYAADHGHPTAIFSLEMGKRDLSLRTIAQTYRIDMHRLKNRDSTVAAELARKMADNPRTSKNRPLFTREKLFDLYDISSQLRILKKKEGLELAIIDYVGLVEAYKMGQNFKSIYERMSFISREFKKLAKELNIPIVLLCQMNREIEKEKRFPMLSDLRDSGSLEQDADMIVFIHRTQDNEHFIVVAKNRQGSTGNIPVIFNGSYQLFLEQNRQVMFDEYGNPINDL